MVRFAHKKRNIYIANLISTFNPKTLIDYGAGDGELYKNLDLKALSKVVLFDPDMHMIKQLNSNLGRMSGFDRCIVTNKINTPLPKYDLILCLEVLEHLPMPERIKFYKFCSSSLTSKGTCIIEVPVEYGPILLLKEFGRKYFKGRSTEYGFKELCMASFFGVIKDKHNRFDSHDNRTSISPHHGFDLFKFVMELRYYGNVKFLYNSPFKFLPKIFNQSVVIQFQPHP